MNQRKIIGEKMKVAIIDDGVASEAVSGLAKLEKYGVSNNRILRMDKYEDESVFSHGSICAKIILKCCPVIELISIKVIRVNGHGSVEYLKKALEWCLVNEIDMVNISAGVEDSFCGKEINKLCYELYRRGTKIIAANCNEDRLSYPAVSPYVLCVQQTTLNYFIKHQVWKPDIMAEGRHRIVQNGSVYYSDRCNSFACAFISGQLARQDSDEDVYRNKIHVRDFNVLYDVCYFISKKKEFYGGMLPMGGVMYDKNVVNRCSNLVILGNKRDTKKLLHEILDCNRIPRSIVWCGKKAPHLIRQFCADNGILYWDERELMLPKRNRLIKEPIVYVGGDIRLAHQLIGRLKTIFEKKGYRVESCTDVKYGYLFGYWKIKNQNEIGMYAEELKLNMVFVLASRVEHLKSDSDVRINVGKNGEISFCGSKEVVSENKLYDLICEKFT